MARHQHLITYKDGSRRYVDRAERDSLLLSRQIKEIAGRHYAFVGEVKTFHSFADLAPLYAVIEPNPVRRYLDGSFIFEFKDSKHRERLETPEAMAFRLQQTGKLTVATA